MKISKKKLTQMVKESILNNENIANLLVEKVKMPPKPSDNKAFTDIMLPKFQGAAEYQHAAKDFIQFIANYKAETATIQHVQNAIEAAISELGVDEGEAKRLAGVLRRIFVALGARAEKAPASDPTADENPDQ